MADTAIQSSGFSLGTALRTFVARIRAAAAERAAYNRTFHELSALSDRELADIGLRRADIERIADEHAQSR